VSRNKKIFITGATGFVGSALVHRLAKQANLRIIAMVRKKHVVLPDQVTLFEPLQTDPFAEALPLNDVHTVIHAAARVHVINESTADPLAEFRNVNVKGTLSLAQQAAAAEVKRFIFISSIKVNGEATALDRPFNADSTPAPSDPYGISKMEAELGLRAISAETGMEVVIIRPVLVYGPGVKANFRNMMSWLNRGVPLPLSSIRNKRSLVALDNLVDLIVTCIDHPAAANQTFLVSDGEDLSTPELLRRMGQAIGKPARLVPAPEGLIRLGAKLIGKEGVAQRLYGSLQVDPQKTFDLLGWRPPVSVDQALYAAAQHYLEHQNR
jgi:nucleoside-diphosphate-sugar epimerase